MPKLRRLIDSLYPHELERLKTLKLEGKQAALMQEAIAAYRTHFNPELESGPRPKLSDTHRYQITSVLLRRALDVLVPEGGLAVLRFLSRKQLPLVLRGEFKRIERETINGADRKTKQRFYYEAHLLLVKLLRRPPEAALIEHCRKRYAAAVKNDPIEMLVFDGSSLPFEIKAAFRYLADPERTTALLEKKLAAYTKKAEKCGDPRCLFFQALADAHAHFWIRYDAVAFAHSLARARRYLDALDQPIYADRTLRMRLLEVDALMVAGKTAEAFDGYHRLFPQVRFEDDLWDDPYFVMRYAELAIVNDRLDLAEEILSTHCAFLPYVLPNFATTSAILLRCLIYLLSDRAEQVPEQVAIAFLSNSKQNFNLFADVRIRIVQCAAFAMQHDLETVEILCDRALQFLRSRKLGVRTYNVGNYFLLLRAFSRQHERRMPIPAELVEFYRIYIGGTYGVYGILLEHVKSSLSVTLP